MTGKTENGKVPDSVQLNCSYESFTESYRIATYVNTRLRVFVPPSPRNGLLFVNNASPIVFPFNNSYLFDRCIYYLRTARSFYLCTNPRCAPRVFSSNVSK
jgi:hypothetical protein